MSLSLAWGRIRDNVVVAMSNLIRSVSVRAGGKLQLPSGLPTSYVTLTPLSMGVT